MHKEQQAKALAWSLQTKNWMPSFPVICNVQCRLPVKSRVLQGISTRIDAGLRERCYGGFEGQLYSEIPHVFPEAYAAWKRMILMQNFLQGKIKVRRHVSFTNASSSIEHYAKQFEGKNRPGRPRCVLECAYRAAKDCVECSA
jgi:probable phosphoglycerate mutase